jgi:hypothetical protein
MTVFKLRQIKMEEAEAWQKGLPEGLADHADLADIKSVEALAQNFVDRGSFLKTSIRVPGDEASDETRAEFHAKLTAQVPGLMPTPDFTNADTISDLQVRMGRPEKASEYTNPEGVEVPDAAAAKDMAFSMGLSQAQFERMVGTIMQSGETQTATMKENQLGNILELKKEWGLAYDDNKGHVSTLLEVMEAPEGMKQAFLADNMDTGMVKFLAGVAQAIGGESIIPDNGSEAGSKLSPAQAQVELDELMSNKDHPYWDSRKAGHSGAKIRVEELTAATLA